MSETLVIHTGLEELGLVPNQTPTSRSFSNTFRSPRKIVSLYESGRERKQYLLITYLEPGSKEDILNEDLV